MQEVEPKIEQDAILIDDKDDDEMEIEKANSITYNYIPAPGKTSFDTQLRLCKQKQISKDEDPESTILRRLVKFFQYNKKIQPGSEYFSIRKEPNNQSQLIENQIIIFGCDFKKLKIVKKEYQTNNYVIINPSNFKLIYTDRKAAWRALYTNAKDPTQLRGNKESDDPSLPRNWIEMKPYICMNRQVRVFARYATEEERSTQPMKEEWTYIYNKCKEVFNTQQEERKEKQILDIERKKEKLEFHKQKNSNKLYEKFQNENQEAWQKGRNANPGAHRDRSRSRSRSRSKINRREVQKIVNQDINDNKSDSSFIINKKLNEINNALNDFQIAQHSIQKNSQMNLSFEIRAPEEASEYQWSGKKGQVTTKYNWSYSEYMKKAEQQEQLARHQKQGKIPVVTIED